MRERYLIVVCLVLAALGVTSAMYPEWAGSILIVVVVSAVAVFLFRKHSEERAFLTKVFFGALAARLALGLFIHVYNYRDFFGPDANTYDINGFLILEYWAGQIPANDISIQRISGIAGWGMNYIVAAIYYLFGRNILAAQSFCAVVGAATAPMVYFCAAKMFHNKRVAKMSALAIAFFPSFVIWSSQLMKDGLIIFLLVLAMTMVLHLQERFSYVSLALLVLSLFGILSLRFYIFYMVAIAVVGSFVVGTSGSFQSIARRTAALIFLGLGLTYLGVIRNASVDLERYASLERIQASRQDLAQSAESGFNEDVDVSTAEGAITAVPIGLVYLMFAPFPWTMTNFRQAITLPEVLLWWAMMPLLVSGLVFAVKRKLRNSIAVLIFTLMLTLAYSIFQGNVGTAYRQRTQIQVFLFMFISVGVTLYLEKREDRKLMREARRRQVDEALRARSLMR